MASAFMKKLDGKIDPRLTRRGRFVRWGDPGEGPRALDAMLLSALAPEEQREFDRARALDPSGALALQ